MDDTTEGIIAVILYVTVMALGVWSNRNAPGFWSAEAIRARGRIANRMIASEAGR
jgi:hypothetical protein